MKKDLAILRISYNFKNKKYQSTWIGLILNLSYSYLNRGVGPRILCLPYYSKGLSFEKHV